MCAAVKRKTGLVCHVPMDRCDAAVKEVNNLNGS